MRLIRPLFAALTLLAAAPAASAATATAQPEAHGVAAAFGNTVKARYNDGRYERIWLQPDGQWEAVGRRGGHMSGKWSLKDDRLCMRQQHPFPAPFKYCTDFPANGGLNTVWTGHDWQGEPIQLSLVRGVERPAAPGQ